MVRDSDVPRDPKVSSSGAKSYTRGRSFYARLTRRDFLVNLEKRRPPLNLTIRTPEWQEQSWERGTGPATRILVRTLWQRPQCHSSISLPFAVAKLCGHPLPVSPSPSSISARVKRRTRVSIHIDGDATPAFAPDGRDGDEQNPSQGGDALAEEQTLSTAARGLSRRDQKESPKKSNGPNRVSSIDQGRLMFTQLFSRQDC